MLDKTRDEWVDYLKKNQFVEYQFLVLNIGYINHKIVVISYGSHVL